MTISLSNGTTTVDLPDDLTWPDEFTWQQVEQSVEYTTTGALVVDAFAKQAGRPITLQGSETFAWCDRGDLLTLRNWASQPGATFALTLRGVTRTVIFNHEAGAIEAEAILDYSDPLDSDPYAITIRFLEL
jgi:hypothetical protein